MNGLRWIRHLLTRGRMARDVADEIDLHLEEKIDELMAAGLTRQEASAEARRTFGNVTLVREESRDIWRWRALDDVAGDIRYAVRQLRRAPSFAAAAILTLAIGIGANSAVFSVVNAVVLRPLPFPSPEKLLSVELMSVRGRPHPSSLAYFTFFELRRAAVVERIACYRDSGVTLTGGDLPVAPPGNGGVVGSLRRAGRAARPRSRLSSRRRSPARARGRHQPRGLGKRSSARTRRSSDV